MPDQLDRILRRALHRAQTLAEARAALRRQSSASAIAEDYARRLAEKHLYRQLLSEERFDGLRFRWYFTRVKRDTELDELRLWIDHKILEEDGRQAPGGRPPCPDQRT